MKNGGVHQMELYSTHLSVMVKCLALLHKSKHVTKYKYISPTAVCRRFSWKHVDPSRDRKIASVALVFQGSIRIVVYGGAGGVA